MPPPNCDYRYCTAKSGEVLKSEKFAIETQLVKYVHTRKSVPFAMFVPNRARVHQGRPERQKHVPQTEENYSIIPGIALNYSLSSTHNSGRKYKERLNIDMNT